MRSPFVAAALLVLLSVPTVADDPVVYSGCLKSSNGQLYAMHEDSVPMYPCDKDDRVVSWNMAGVQGPVGPRGPAGPGGPAAPVEGTQTSFWLYAREHDDKRPIPEQCQGRNIVVERVAFVGTSDDRGTWGPLSLLAIGATALTLPPPSLYHTDTANDRHYSAAYEVTWRIPSDVTEVWVETDVKDGYLKDYYTEVNGYCVDPAEEP